jgi:hypothetical protein
MHNGRCIKVTAVSQYAIFYVLWPFRLKAQHVIHFDVYIHHSLHCSFTGHWLNHDLVNDMFRLHRALNYIRWYA